MTACASSGYWLDRCADLTDCARVDLADIVDLLLGIAGIDVLDDDPTD